MKILSIAIMVVMVSASAFGVTVELTLSDDSIVAGQSTGVVILVKNGTTEPFRLPPHVVLEVTSERDGVFLSSKAPLVLDTEPVLRPIPGTFRPTPDGLPVIGPGQDFLFSIPFHGSISFFNDRRLSWPGNYGLRAGLTDIGEEVIWSDQKYLRVEEPTGIDKQVWDLMLKQTEGAGWGYLDWTGSDLGQTVWNLYRESSYTPFVLGRGAMIEAEWEEMRPYAMKGPFKPYILLGEARRHWSEWWKVFSRDYDLGTAQRALSETRRMYEDIVTETDDPYAASLAQEVLKDLPSRGGLANIARKAGERKDTECWGRPIPPSQP